VAADPQWLRSSLAEDLAAFDRAHGRIPHTRSIERVVDEDIRRWQAVERERKATPPPAAPVKVEGDKRHDVAKRTAEGKQGEHVGRMRFDARDAIADEQRAPCACGGAACRRCKLRLRIAALMEPAPLTEHQRVPASESWKNAKHPSYAREVYRVWEWMTFNPRARRLREARPVELEREVTRKLEDIADRSSTAVIGLGPWR
jgi:hypothetical protein